MKHLKNVSLPLLFVLLFFCQSASSQSKLNNDEIIRRLGGDPDRLREEAVQRAKAASTPEEVALRERAKATAKTITEEHLASMSTDDPLLLAIYAERVQWTEDATLLWTHVIDRDIQRRKDAYELMRSIFRTNRPPYVRNSVMHWLDKNRELKWGNTIMEEAIELYRAEPNAFDSYYVAMLARLVAGRGDESHLAFFDELEKNGIGGGFDRTRLENRIKEAKEKGTSAPAIKEHLRADIESLQPTKLVSLGQKHDQVDEKGGMWNQWLTGTVIMAAISLLWLLLKNRK